MTDVLESIAPAEKADAPLSRFRPYPEYKDSGVEWLGEVPIHWTVIRLKHVSRMRSGISITQDSIESTGDFPVYGGNGLRGYTDSFTHDGFYILIGRQGALCGNIMYAKGRFWASEHAIVVTPSPGIDQIWLGEILRSMNLNQYSVAAAQPGIAADTIQNLSIALPSSSEQEAIASFLDRETAKIDALIARKERFIELLEEQRSAVISHAVTKGLDPNVSMKDSGIPSVGIVPTQWEVIRNKTLFVERMERSEDGSEELLTVSHLTGITPRREKDVNMFLAESMEGYKRCYAGDVVINTMWAWMGALGVSSYDGIVSPSYNVYRIRDKYRDRIDLEFLDLLYRIPEYITEINRHSTGIWRSRLRLYPEAFLTMTTPLPPLREQREIIAHLVPTIDRANAFHAKLSESINELREYRTALISAAVTGKIDVRGEAAI